MKAPPDASISVTFSIPFPIYPLLSPIRLFFNLSPSSPPPLYTATREEVMENYGVEWDRVLITTLGVANKRLYELRCGRSVGVWGGRKCGNRGEIGRRSLQAALNLAACRASPCIP